MMRRFVLDWVLPIVTASLVFSMVAAGAIRIMI